jgi:hypothetical protein
MTGVQSPVPEATQVLGTRESGSAPSGSQAKSSGAVNPQQAARQPDEAMSSGASGWAGSQPRRCAGRQAGAHRRGEEKGPRRALEVNGFENKSCVLRVFFIECFLRRNADPRKNDRPLQQAEHQSIV